MPSLSRTILMLYSWNHINHSPGTRCRELQPETRLADGRLEYHLKILEDLNQIKVKRFPTRKSQDIIIQINPVTNCAS